MMFHRIDTILIELLLLVLIIVSVWIIILLDIINKNLVDISESVIKSFNVYLKIKLEHNTKKKENS